MLICYVGILICEALLIIGFSPLAIGIFPWKLGGGRRQGRPRLALIWDMVAFGTLDANQVEFCD